MFSVDDYAYFKNNRTEQPDFVHPLLNFTNSMARNWADVIPFCYMMYVDAKEAEVARFATYDGYGDIAIAFLFNQMGNAVDFQQKFENIKLDKETQNYQGVWMEYGHLVHIIWDF